jgi:hypothetical protein
VSLKRKGEDGKSNECNGREWSGCRTKTNEDRELENVNEVKKPAHKY